jgi:hypothetical protein
MPNNLWSAETNGDNMQRSIHSLDETTEVFLPTTDVIKYAKELESRDWRVRLSAAKALAQLKNPEAVDPLIVALKDKNWKVRHQAAWALGHIGDLRAVEPLGIAYKEWGWQHNYSAAISLWGIGGNKLPWQILSSVTLSPVQKLNSLETLSGVTIRLIKPGYGTLYTRYGVDDLKKFCEDLCNRVDTEGSVKQGATAVLSELQHRVDANTLLRANEGNSDHERLLLLRGTSRPSEETSSGELLRPSKQVSEQAHRRNSSILSRILKSK